MNKQEGLEEVALFIKEEDNFVVATHIQPDGDTIGSVLALGLFLKKMGKGVHMCWSENVAIPPHYKFVPGVNELLKPDKCPARIKNFIAVDCASIQRLGDLKDRAIHAETLVNIDHHRDNTRFGNMNLVDESYSASAEIIYDLIISMDSSFDLEVATGLYVGLVTDTGRFQYGNTTSRTFEIVLDLVKRGVSPSYIFQNIYENYSYGCLRLLGRVLERARLIPEVNLIYSTVSRQDLKEMGISMEETENFIDYLRAVRAANVAVIFKEMSDGKTKVSIRSKGMDIAKIAKKFHGGGHPNAAGFSSNGTIEEILEGIVGELKKS